MVETLEIPIALQVSVDGDKLFGRAHLEAKRRRIEVDARAMRHVDGSIDDWALDLVTARLLRALEIELMEQVHERIDRSVTDDV